MGQGLLAHAGVGVQRVGVVAEPADLDAAAGQVLDQFLGLAVGQGGHVDVGHAGIAAGRVVAAGAENPLAAAQSATSVSGVSGKAAVSSPSFMVRSS